MTIDEARDLLGEDDTFTLFADGFDEAFIGLATRNHQVLAIYSQDTALDILEQQMTEACDDPNNDDHEECFHWDEGLEHFNFNVIGAWVGEGTPLWLDDSSAIG